MATARRFSDDTDVGDAQVNDTVTGLRGSENVRFDIPGTGFKDTNGNYLLKWFSVGANAVNYITFTNSISGQSTIIGADGADADVTITITPKGAGDFRTQNIALTSSTISSIIANSSLFLTPNGCGS